MLTKTLLITGGAAGIGLAVAQRFAREGWQIGLVDLDPQLLQQAADALGEACVGHWAVDVSDAPAMKGVVESFVEQTDGRLRVLFNSAGVLRTGAFAELTPATHQQLMAVNVNGVINACHAAYPYLKACPGARVINMSSASALYGVPTMASYSASKFAVSGLTEALDIEWAADDIRVTDIMPPFVRTNMLESQALKPPIVERMGVNLVAEDVAEAVWESLDSSAVHHPVGFSFRLLAGASKWTPVSINRALMKWLSRPEA
ncbi:MAG: SDR family oxidoreductase [Halomonadaceae bacterium]|nr:MAG: SDR family oxidoreductase [Halomonadaceae bacterium]